MNRYNDVCTNKNRANLRKHELQSLESLPIPIGDIIAKMIMYEE